jgi:hypothetical protein
MKLARLLVGALVKIDLTLARAFPDPQAFIALQLKRSANPGFWLC